MVFLRLLPAIALVFAALSLPATAQPRILTIGDSMMAAHSISGRAIPHYLAKALKAKVSNRSVTGARMIYKLPLTGAMGFSIPKQFRGETWDWVVINGGGNDLWLGCGCHRCERKLNKLISTKGNAGEIPRLVARIRKTGAKVLYVGYLRSPGVGSPIESCKDDGDILEDRLAAMAKLDSGIHFLSNKDLVPHGDRSFHGIDMIHPSLKGSREIAMRIARYIAKQKG